MGITLANVYITNDIEIEHPARAAFSLSYGVTESQLML